MVVEGVIVDSWGVIVFSGVLESIVVLEVVVDSKFWLELRGNDDGVGVFGHEL